MFNSGLSLSLAHQSPAIGAGLASPADIPASYTLHGIHNGVNVEGWKLIKPVTVTVNGVGKTFYYLDASGDGTISGADYLTHIVLNSLFNGGAPTTDAARSSTTLIPGRTVLLATGPSTTGFSLTNGSAANTSDLAAIWDAFNGSGTDGTPPGWERSNYWSATPSALGHALVGINGGYVSNLGDGNVRYVALQVA